MRRPSQAAPGRRVYAYRNLHKGCWSLRALDGPDRGRVIAHADDVALAACEFRVSEKVRQRVLRERKKYVHAGVVGHVLAAAPDYQRAGKRLRYNPYEGPSFTADGAPVRAADVVRLGADGRCQAWGTAQ
ncbi:hypothetical protein [Phenylobacterium sp.]|uniref:hypothetical protein n=1 Tax=Phenylobacterium sp. TaxID=1871053 RepID=UPI0039366FBD